MENETPLCGCGCGQHVRLPEHRFLHGHRVRLYSSEEQAVRSRGKLASEETREKLREAWRAFKAGNNEPVDDPALLSLCACGCGEKVRRAKSRYLHGHHSRTIDHTELAARVCGARTGMTHTPEARQKIRESRKQFLANGGQVWNKGLTKDIHPSVGLHNKGQFQSAADHYDRSFPTTSTSLEAILQIALWEKGIPFLFNVPIRHICRPDFLFPDARIVVQLDAAYWHRGREDKDASQDAALEGEGWLVFRWEEKAVRKNLSTLLDTLIAAYVSRLPNCQVSSTLVTDEPRV